MSSNQGSGAVRNRLWIAAFAFYLAASCSGKAGPGTDPIAVPPPAPPPPPPAPTTYFGTYTLRSSNGVAVPGTYLQGANYRLDITGGEVILNSAFTYQFAIRFRLTRGSLVTTPQWTETGTFTGSVSPGLVILQLTGGPATSGMSTIFNSDLSFILETPVTLVPGPDGAAVYLGDAHFIR